MWERLELEPSDARRLLGRQAAWTMAQAAMAGGLAWAGADPPIALALATGIGAAATKPARLHALPLVVAFVVATTMLLGAAGVPYAVAAGAAAGLAVGGGGLLTRLECVLAGMAGGGLGLWLADGLPLSQGPLGVALGAGAIVGIGVSQALLPASVRHVHEDRIPSPGRITSTLGAEYRPPCMRAWQLDQELAQHPTDRTTRRGLAEVAAWVYRLGLTLQTLDGDLARIDPVSLRQRRDTLAADTSEDAFIRERRAETAQHLARMLEHRDTLSLERDRTASLQEYALAYLEEARAGLALARALPGDRPPEGLTVVLDKLRAQASEGGTRRRTAREMEGMTAR